MKKEDKMTLYGAILVLELSMFLSMMIFEKPDGKLGLMICVVSIYFMLGGLIKLSKMSKRFANSFLQFLDLLFWIP